MDISNKGARVAGVRASLAMGDTVGLQYRNRQARFRVSWIGQPCSPTGTQVGLHCLEAASRLWQMPLPGDEPDEYEIPEARPRKYESRHDDRRSQTRYPVSGKAYVSSAYGGEGIWAKLEDISLNGCYLRTAHVFAVGRKIALQIKIADNEIKADGIVRVSYPRTAMGIEFTHIAPPARRVLCDLTSYLDEIENMLGTLTPAS